ncbi:hypothetical protein T4A_11695 [Trichinella pseudospiralis]|uniref:C2H2-type domain-containing protein n=1 Tax=Trichinella pseudospiralis TaxID=6337 RepID=A0A0V1DZL2_TRIPS|nr:hypothetical protein T4A_11695 [Trichinella pseudospiralis]
MSKFSCGKCGAIITGNDEWEDHIKMHLNNDDYVCYKCGMHLPSLTELIEHYKDHLPSCSKQWSSKSENDDREKKSLRDNVSRKLKFDKPTVLYDSRNRNENMPELMKQVDELKLKASLIFKNVNKKKEIKKLHYPILNSRTAKKGAQVLSKWRKYLEDEKNEIVNYQETTKHEKGEVTSGVNNDHLYCVRAISDKEYMKQKEEVLFQSGNHDKNQGRDSDFAKSETLDKENGAFVRMFKKYLEEERKQEKKQERKKKNENESKIDKNTMMFDDVENGKKATKYEEEWSEFGRNNDCVYFAKWIKPEDLLKQKKENSFCSHKEEQGVESDVIKSETLDEEGAAFVRMFKKYLEEERKQEQKIESKEKGEDESDIEEIIIMRDNDENITKATKYEEEWSEFGRNNDCVYFAKWIKPEDLLKQKKENSFCSHKEEQGVESDVIKSEPLDEEGGAFVRMFKKYLEEEKKQEQENESEEKGEDESDMTISMTYGGCEAAVDEGDETFEFMKMVKRNRLYI